MIPRFKPHLNKEECVAAIQHRKDAVACFEHEFAQTFEAKYAIAFPYGRSGLWAFFKALGIEGAEVVMPAYTCVVVAHAIVLSNNIPRFVDITLYDYNMDLNDVEKAIHERTRAIVATHLFGYPLNIDWLNVIVRDAEARYGHKIWVIQDCAHSFGAYWQGKLVCNEGDVALFGLNISKMITSVFGGMITMNDPELYSRLRAFRDKHFVQPGLVKRIRRFLYLLAIYPAFNERLYGLVNWLQEKTFVLNRLTKAYHLDDKIHFPPDYLDQMVHIEAQVGLAQLRKYPQIVRHRQENARYYTENLQDVNGIILPPQVEGATYSHYVIRVPEDERVQIIDKAANKGVQLGTVVDYVIPEMRTYVVYRSTPTPYSCKAAQTVVNLPLVGNKKLASRVLEAVGATLEHTG